MARSSVSRPPVATTNGHAVLPGIAPARNPGLPLDLGWVQEARFTNRSATERRAATLPARRSVKKTWQVAWLLRAVTCLDLTTLQGDDTPGNVRRLCAKARQPVRRDILDMLGVGQLPITVGAVCVYHNLVETAVEALAGSGIPVAAVSTGFPAGQTPLESKLAEIRASVAAGASEIDIVISRADVLTGDYAALYDEVRTYRETCGDAHMKTIIATGELGTLRNVRAASLVCMMAGADFIKTSTGKEPTNATLPGSLIMVRAARDYFDRTGEAARATALRHRVVVRRRVAPCCVVPQLPLDIGEQSASADAEQVRSQPRITQLFLHQR